MASPGKDALRPGEKPRPPVIAPGHTFGSVTDHISAIVL